MRSRSNCANNYPRGGERLPSRGGTYERSPTPQNSLVLEVRNSENKKKWDGPIHMCNAVGMPYGVFSQQLTFLLWVKPKTTWDTQKLHKFSTGAEALNLPTTKRTKLWKIRKHIMRRQDHLQTDLLQITINVNKGKEFNNTKKREED